MGFHYILNPLRASCSIYGIIVTFDSKVILVICIVRCNLQTIGNRCAKYENEVHNTIKTDDV